MKKKVTAILVVAMLLACAVFGIAGANNSEKVTVLLNGEEVIFDEATPPVWKNYQLMVEMSTIMDKLWVSARVQDTGIIQCTRDMDKMSLMLNSDVANIKNEILKMEVSPFKIDGTNTVMVPLQILVEGFGGSYIWDSAAKTASIEIEAAQTRPLKSYEYMLMPYDDPNTEGVDGITVSSDGMQASYGAHKDCAIDGDYGTRWSAPNKGSVDDPDAPEGQYIQFEFEQVATLYGVGLARLYGNGRNYPFSVEVSVDGETWTEVIARRDSMLTDSIELYGWDSQESVEAKFVRVTNYGNPKNQWSHITEMRVFCSADTSGAKEFDLK